jgi:signal transduction histidine kinase
MPTEDLKHWIRTELWDQVPVRISVINRDFEIVDANRSFVEAYGEWQGHPCYAVYKGRSERCEICGAAATFKDGRVRVREEEGVLRDGQPHHYIVRHVPLVRQNSHDSEIPFTIKLSTDITEVKLLEKEKLQAERLAAVGETVAGMAHAIKNILTGLTGGMYAIKSGIKSGREERTAKGWEMLERNVDRITTLVKGFLSFSKKHVPEMEEIDPRELAREVFSLYYAGALKAGVTLLFEGEEGIRAASMEPSGIHTCLANLVSNAIDACKTSKKEGCGVSLRVKQGDGSVVFEVEDTGCGMEPEIREKVFKTLFTTKGLGGTGLGLLVTKKIVREHGGRIEVESEPGEGSRFRLELPRDGLERPSEDSQGDLQLGDSG